jgi:cell division protein FtsA
LSRQALAEVVEPRYEELFTLIQSELRRSGFEDLVAAGIVLTGGTARMEGVVELAEEIFHMPVRLASPQGVTGLTDVVNNPMYATGVGLLMYGLQQQEAGFVPAAVVSEPSVSAWTKLKQWFTGNF